MSVVVAELDELSEAAGLAIAAGDASAAGGMSAAKAGADNAVANRAAVRTERVRFIYGNLLELGGRSSTASVNGLLLL